MVSPQIFLAVQLTVALGASGCLVRLHLLRLFSVYPAFVVFLLAQIATILFTLFAGVSTGGYAYTYLALLMLEWLAYGLMINELHESIFSRFPGIAILGRWSIYAALAATLAIFFLGVASVWDGIVQSGTLLIAFEFASHCLLFGFAALIVITLIAVSKYPLELHKNIIVNCAFFSLILLGEASVLLINQITLRHYTTMLNLGISGLEAACLIIWSFTLSREGQTEVLKLRSGYSSKDEARLLRQLSAVNSLLLRAVRR